MYRSPVQEREVDSDERLKLVEEAFGAIAQCAAMLRESGVKFEEDALDLMIGNVGLRLAQIGLNGDQAQLSELKHWKDHARLRCEGLVKNAVDRNGGTITWGDVHTMWLKPPAPGITVLDDMKEKFELRTDYFQAGSKAE